MDGSTPLFLPQMGAVYQAVTPVAETLVRVVVGLALVPHALRFCFGLFPDSGSRILSFDILTAALERSGYRPGRVWALAIAATELAGGPLLALGLFTRPVALVIFIFHLNAMIEHWRFDGYFWNKLGLEYAMIWAAATLIFVVQGGGPYSLDAWLVGRQF
ncbi:MAG TPA: DoxX family protein [Stellaceae bacterium]|nr:DoxX family protein [Stellaceae bacterium]